MPHNSVALIVEDEHLIRALAVDTFLGHGFEVLEAENAAEALSVCRDDARVDLLFTDVNMPGFLDGIDLAEAMKRQRPDLVVIITSALPAPRTLGHLAATFVAKPYEVDFVCAMARSLLTASSLPVA